MEVTEIAAYTQSSFTEEDIPQLIGIKTDVAGYFFDAVLKLNHERRLAITDHPVEEGANIADHAYLKQKVVSIEIGMSDVCTDFIDGQFAQGFTRSVSAFETLERLQAEREPISIHSRLATYENMLIENITAPDDYLTKNGLKATVFFREMIIAKTDTVTLPNRTSAAPQKTGNTNRGAVQPVADDRSTLRRGFDALRG